MEPVRLQACILQQVFDNRKLATGDQIATDVVAVAGVSTRYPDTIDSSAESIHDKLGTHSPRAGNPHYSDVGRIFHPADPGKVSRSITAPVTKERDNLWFEHDNTFPLIY